MAPLTAATEAQLTTTTTTAVVPRVVGDHPGTVPVVAAGAGLFVVVMVAGFVARRSMRR